MDYRVFDKKKKKWITDKVFLTPEGDLYKTGQSFLGWTKPTYLHQDRYVYQKSIDLTDKNGVEIFIGDYLEAKVDENKTVKGVVVFAEELSSFIILCDDTYNDANEFFTLGNEVCEFIEIVGNVFDELKKGK